MTGTPNSKHPLRLWPLALLACASPARADELSLSDDAHLVGTVTAIAENGSVRLESPLSSEPLLLRPGAVQKMVFSGPAEAPRPGTTRVILKGGEILPCELKGLDGDSLKVATSFSDELKLPRASLSAMELGILSEKALVSTPTGIEGWTTQAWKFKENGFSSTNNGPLSHAFDLPDQYIIRFRLSWRNLPNIRICFADPLENGAKPIDRYFIQFNNAGIALQRQNSTGRTYIPFITLGRRPDSFPKSQVDIEVRVDRTQSMIWLYLDGNLEGRFKDPGPAPKSGGMSFESNAGNDTEHRITDFRILSWDATGDRHRTEDRGDKKSDSLIDTDGDRYSGRLESINLGQNADATLTFKSPLLEKPLSIPAKKVSTVFFADESKAAVDAPTTPLLMKLRDGGTLKVQSCVFSGDNAQVRHSLLGALQLKRAAIISIEQVTKPTSSEPAPSE